MKFPKGKSGNPGGRPKVLGELQELARLHAPDAIAELGRLSLKAKNENARIAAIRELLDRGFGRARQTTEVVLPGEDIIQTMLDEIDARNRESNSENTVNLKQSEAQNIIKRMPNKRRSSEN
jgi:hypothetical protein